jgi:hypothetical protein
VEGKSTEESREREEFQKHSRGRSGDNTEDDSGDDSGDDPGDDSESEIEDSIEAAVEAWEKVLSSRTVKPSKREIDDIARRHSVVIGGVPSASTTLKALF